jgi:DNA invertase Pin-like site-specific DNA recombinase
MIIGYARVSTADQNPAHQIDALRRAGVADRDIHVDYASGAKASRPKLDLVLQLLREDDVLTITRLDRLGRSLVHLITLAADLRDRGVQLRILDQGIDTTTPEGRAMFGMLGVLAGLQRELIVANTRDGLQAARARGRVGVRRPAAGPPNSRRTKPELRNGSARRLTCPDEVFGKHTRPGPDRNSTNCRTPLDA